jgi:actin-related protein
LDPRVEWKVIEKIKKEYSYLSLDLDEELKKLKPTIKKFELESKEIILLEEEVFLCNEILFDPTLYGIQSASGGGLHHSIFDVLTSSSSSSFERLTKNLILSGGNMKIGGLVNRLEKEMKEYSKLHGSEKGFKGKPTLLNEYSTWRGGVDYTTKCNWIKKSDYNDYGSGIIYKNCF